MWWEWSYSVLGNMITDWYVLCWVLFQAEGGMLHGSAMEICIVR